MIFSGADLIRNSGRQAERAERLKEASPVQAPTKKEATDQDTNGALLRFARFIHGEKEKKKRQAPKPAPKRHGTHPYLALQAREEAEAAKGNTLDIAV